MGNYGKRDLAIKTILKEISKKYHMWVYKFN